MASRAVTKPLTVAVFVALAGTGGAHPAVTGQTASSGGGTVPTLAPVNSLPAASSLRAQDAAAEDAQALQAMFPSERYRITVGDVLELNFPYVPEFEQTVSVQPDGYVSVRAAGEVLARGLTVADLKAALVRAYEPILNEPVISIVLKEFEKPYVVVGGEVQHPGKYELRGAMTVTEALAIAGGKTSAAKLSDVLLFRRYGSDLVSVKKIDVKKMYEKRDLSEDPVLRSGDMLFLPKSTLSSIAPWIPRPGLGIFANPAVK